MTPGLKVLCLSPHPDDVEFGLGATIHRFANLCDFHILVFSDRSVTRGENNNSADQLRAAALLGLSEEKVRFIDYLYPPNEMLPIRFFATGENRDRMRLIIARMVEDLNPGLIFVPSPRETMQDHSAMGEEVERVVRGMRPYLAMRYLNTTGTFGPTFSAGWSQRIWPPSFGP